jgi:S1 RNA binding domain protein
LADGDIVVGAVVEGVVTGITNFGAFVSLPNGKTGLVHISEVADTYVRDIKDYLKENDAVKVKIISYDGKNKIGLSIRQAQPKPSGQERRGPPGKRLGSSRMSFEDKLARFMKESDEKLSELKKHHEGRGGSRHRRGGRPDYF